MKDLALQRNNISFSERQNKYKSKLPVYTKGEDLFNAISHIVGGAFGIIFAVLGLWMALRSPTAEKITAVIIYSLSIIILYTMSALYHFLPIGRAKYVFRIFDHCTIYLLIAGCYAPFCLILFWAQPIGKVIFFTEWGIAVLGITFNAINMNWKAVKILSNVSYVVMGWMIVFVFRQLLQMAGMSCFLYLLLGGIFYTVGIIFYALGKNHKYMHCVWHVFVLLGSIFQFISIFNIL